MRPISKVLWESLEVAGLIAGIVIAVSQLTGFSDKQNLMMYLVTFAVGFATIFNINLYLAVSKKSLCFSYTPGCQAAFKELTRAVNEAKEFIWVTRFSRGSIQDQHEYFDATDRKIRGRGCIPVGSYRRLMNIDSREKTNYARVLLENFYNAKNFYLKGTTDSQYFEIILIDHRWVFIAFHHPDHSGDISALLAITDPAVIREWELIYESLWNDPDAYNLKAKIVLTPEERDATIKKVEALKTIA